MLKEGPDYINANYVNVSCNLCGCQYDINGKGSSSHGHNNGST